MNSDLDKGIEQNLDAALIESKLHDGVKYAVKNHVVTLTGEVDSQSKRRAVEGRGFRSERSAGGERTAGKESKGDFLGVKAPAWQERRKTDESQHERSSRRHVS